MEEGIYEVKFKQEEKLKPLIETNWIPKYFAFYLGKDKLKTICLPLRKAEESYIPLLSMFTVINKSIEMYTESDFLGEPSKNGEINRDLFISLEKVANLEELINGAIPFRDSRGLE